MTKKPKNARRKNNKPNKDTELQDQLKKLQVLIETYNYVPANAWKTWEEIEKEVDLLRTKQHGNLYDNEWKTKKNELLENAVNAQLKEMPKLVKKYDKQGIFGQAYRSKRMFYQRYDEFREAFNGIVELNYWKDHITQTIEKSWDVFANTENFNLVTISDTGNFQVKKTKSGVDLLLEAIDGIKPDYLRRCSFCLKIFWATDLRQEYCSVQCRNKRNSEKNYAKPEKRKKILSRKKARYERQKSETETAKKQRQEKLKEDFSKNGAK